MQPDPEIERLAHETIGAAIEVHRHLGPRFLESVYESALAIELTQRGILCERQVITEILCKGRKVGEARIDLLVGGCLVVELKAVDSLLAIHKAQMRSYLKALSRPLGLIINFKVEVLRQGIQRIIRSSEN